MYIPLIKPNILNEMYLETIKSLKDPSKWKKFLSSSPHNYKCNFNEQVLIYAQKPTATAVLTFERWSKTFNRRIGSGVKGIAVINTKQKSGISYYYDISDTHETQNSKAVPIWNYSTEYENDVIKTLNSAFNTNQTDLISAVFSSVQNKVSSSSVQNKDFIISSVAYSVISRLGLDTQGHFSESDFNFLAGATTTQISDIGVVINSVTKEVLNEISNSIKNIQKSIEKENTKEYNTNNSNALKRESVVKGEFNNGNNLQESRGRSPANRPSDRTRDNSTRNSGENNDTSDKEQTGRGQDFGSNEQSVRKETKEIPTEFSPSDIQGDERGRNTNSTPRGNIRTGNRNETPHNRRDGEERGSDRGTQSKGHNALGTNDEQHHELGNGNSVERTNIHINNEMGTAENVVPISQLEIDSVLCKGSGYVDSKYRIYQRFSENKDDKENALFLSKEYGTGGRYPVLTGDRELYEAHGQTGISLSSELFVTGKDVVNLSWVKVASRVRELVENNLYLNQLEMLKYPKFLEEQALINEYKKIATSFRELIMEYNEFHDKTREYEKKLNLYILTDCAGRFARKDLITHTATMKGDYVLPLMIKAMEDVIGYDTQFTDRAKSILDILNSDICTPFIPPPQIEYGYRYNIGDNVYIDNKRYEILAVKESEVTLYDEDFPILNKTVEINEFEEKLKNDNFNDKYKTPLMYIEVSKLLSQKGYVVSDEMIEYSFDELTHSGTKSPTSEALFNAVLTSLESDELLVNNDILTLDSDNISVDGHIGTWYVVESQEFNGTEYFLLENKEYGDETAHLIVDNEKNIVLDEVFNGFGDLEEFLNDEEPILTQTEIKDTEPVQDIKEEKPTNYDTHLQVPMSERHQFSITNDTLGHGTPTEKYTANLEAIRTLKAIESEQRFATAQEQEILSKYVGWGGLSACFEETHTRYAELKNLLTDEEYKNARESTLTAFYTSPIVIRSMYKALENLGFTKGNILEPSCGIGNFIGMIPGSMSESNIYGVELDSISGRISQQLYQKSNISVSAYEKTALPDNFFDVAIGNVPFGQFKVNDKKYNKHNWLIHDYFFGATLDKVRPGGVIAFITSKGTLDKENPTLRKYLSERADLLGAIRLPNNTFKANAGTEVTSDIIFLQKRERATSIIDDWAYLGKNENSLNINQYFIDNPNMVLGELKEVSGPFGPETACVPYEDKSLEELLTTAIANISGQILERELDDSERTEDTSIPADPNVRNHSYTVVDNDIYFRENSVMDKVKLKPTEIERVKGLIKIRDSVRLVIEMQKEDYSDSDIKEEQNNLNKLYDSFTKKYGLISSRTNKKVFSQDSSYPVVTALEHLDEDGKLKSKADIFFKRTIRPHIPVTSVETSTEALAISLAEKARVDIPFMASLLGKGENYDFVIEDLKGIIFKDHLHCGEDNTKARFLTADEYLSGNVREKLGMVKSIIDKYPEFKLNLEMLEKVQPKDLSASEIDVRLGTTWIPTDVVREFMFNLLLTPNYNRYDIHVHFSTYSAEWNIEGKSKDRNNLKATSTYGSNRINAYKIIEDTLNQRDVQIFDYHTDEHGNRKAVLNVNETEIAQGKQKLIKQAFKDWVWTDPSRRERLTGIYNEKFNSTRPREYDGSHLNFSGMNSEIRLKPHQMNAVARTIYGGNTLLAHVVGAGKTYEMIASAVEKKRLGLCNKSMFVVPNHLIGEWGSEFLQLYPSANILVATEKDFKTKNRKKFCARISTGDFDAVIIGHSQFEKIPMSVERQIKSLEQQQEDILNGIDDLKRSNGSNFSVKQLEAARKKIADKLDKLNDQSRKDSVVTFEELGVDSLYVDESHSYKNLATFSKMRNVAGISQTEAQKSSDMYMKCRYMDEITDGKGIIFATGTPIANSMTEMFTLQRYLQYETLKSQSLLHFDAWASNFGETTTGTELAPEGKGFRVKTRFSKFYNLPELINIFKNVADIQTADMLNLPVPKVNYHNVTSEPSDIQKEMVKALSERADRVRNKSVDVQTDNMLMITTDGRKLALDQRLINPMLPDFEGSKINVCADNIYRIWENTKKNKGTQLLFCDTSTPQGEGFNVYDDIRDKLILKGIPKEEIKFIHEAKTDKHKQELFSKVRSGKVRVLIGSTQKCGAGTNIQHKLVALHDIDVPWRPSDLSQRLGRIERQGNENPEVDVFRYITKETFDAYSYQLIEKKQRFISQIMTSKSPVRSIDDVDEATLSYAEIKMLATGNPHIQEKMNLDIEVARLKVLKQHYLSERYSLEDNILKVFPKTISDLKSRIEGYTKDEKTALENATQGEKKFSSMRIGDIVYDDKAEAGTALIQKCKTITNIDGETIGRYHGFDLQVKFDSFDKVHIAYLKGEIKHKVVLGNDINGNILRLDNALEKISEKKTAHENTLDTTLKQLELAKSELEKPFAFEDELNEKSTRLNELDVLLTIGSEKGEEKMGEDKLIKTNMGEMPIEDYREIMADQYGFESYKDMYDKGYRLGNGYDIQSETLKDEAGATETDSNATLQDKIDISALMKEQSEKLENDFKSYLTGKTSEKDSKRTEREI